MGQAQKQSYFPTGTEDRASRVTYHSAGGARPQGPREERPGLQSVGHRWPSLRSPTSLGFDCASSLANPQAAGPEWAHGQQQHSPAASSQLPLSLPALQALARAPLVPNGSSDPSQVHVCPGPSSPSPGERSRWCPVKRRDVAPGTEMSQGPGAHGSTHVGRSLQPQDRPESQWQGTPCSRAVRPSAGLENTQQFLSPTAPQPASHRAGAPGRRGRHAGPQQAWRPLCSRTQGELQPGHQSGPSSRAAQGPCPCPTGISRGSPGSAGVVAPRVLEQRVKTHRHHPRKTQMPAFPAKPSEGSPRAQGRAPSPHPTPPGADLEPSHAGQVPLWGTCPQPPDGAPSTLLSVPPVPRGQGRQPSGSRPHWPCELSQERLPGTKPPGIRVHPGWYRGALPPRARLWLGVLAG